MENGTHDETWHPVLGEQSSYRNYYNESKIYLASSNPLVKTFAICVRVYNEGVAFRYEFEQDEELKVDSELTEFTFATEPEVWVSTLAQSSIDKYKLSDLSVVYERPLLAELNNSYFLALGEAALVDFARMKFERVENSSTTLVSSLSVDTASESSSEVIIHAGKYTTLV